MPGDTLTTYTIDAAGKKLGRVASEAAHVLMGKNRTQFARNTTPNVRVAVTNTDQLVLTEHKRQEKTYRRYSGYPGGLKEERLEEVIAKKGTPELVRRAVYGMLPKNRLRTTRMNRLTITV